MTDSWIIIGWIVLAAILYVFVSGFAWALAPMSLSDDDHIAFAVFWPIIVPLMLLFRVGRIGPWTVAYVKRKRVERRERNRVPAAKVVRR